jgi:Ca2+-binding RTX toxin-like protein
MASGYRKLGVLIGCVVLAIVIGSSVGVTQFEFFTLTVTKTGNGTVTSSPSGINCGNTCSARFREGTQVTLTATPAAGSTVQSWSGCDSSSGNQCTVIMNSNRTVNVTFAAATFTLTVTKSGAGSGTVTSSPSGINCGNTCSASFSPGTVTLTATPSSGSLVDSWSGCNSFSSDKRTCTVNGAAGDNKTVTITFSVGCTLTVTKAGTGSGTVTSNPSGISCGADCSETFVCGTAVTLTATADASSTFRGWGGACSGRSTCSVTVDANKSVTATFALRGGGTAPGAGCHTDNVEGTSQDDTIQMCGTAIDNLIIRGDGNGVFGDGPNACSSSRCGNDLIIGSGDDDRIYGDDSFGGWRATGRDVIYGREGNDTIYGESGNDTIYGGNGDDVIDGGNGNDHLEGDEGNDLLQGGPGRDVLLGGLGDDELYGGSGNDILRGNDGIDTLDGGTGNDIIEGGLDSDFLVGGGGNDTFIVRAGDAGDDIETIICTQAHNEKGRVIFIGEFPDLLLGRFRNTILTVQDTKGSFEIITGPGVCILSRGR